MAERTISVPEGFLFHGSYVNGGSSVFNDKISYNINVAAGRFTYSIGCNAAQYAAFDENAAMGTECYVSVRPRVYKDKQYFNMLGGLILSADGNGEALNVMIPADSR